MHVIAFFDLDLVLVDSEVPCKSLTRLGSTHIIFLNLVVRMGLFLLLTVSFEVNYLSLLLGL